MTETSKTLLEKYQVRKSKKQKSEFISYVDGVSKNLGYSCKVEKGTFGARNIVIGDVKRANVVYTAHYDTCAVLPFPNFITPKNFFIYLIYQIGIVALLFAAIALVEGAFIYFSRALGMNDALISTISRIIYYVMFLAFFFLVLSGPANKHTANDNTSGVATLLDIMHALPEETRENVALVFFDLEESGLFGSSAFASAHKKDMKDKLLINFDCVSDGENILIVVKKKARCHISLLDKAYSANEHVNVEIADRKVFYPSDQANFPVGVGVASLKKTKGGMYYMDKIHTKKDTNFREENISFLTESSVKLAEMLSSK